MTNSVTGHKYTSKSSRNYKSRNKNKKNRLWNWSIPARGFLKLGQDAERDRDLESTLMDLLSAYGGTVGWTSTPVRLVHRFDPSHRPRAKALILCLRLQKTRHGRPKTDWGGSAQPLRSARGGFWVSTKQSLVPNRPMCPANLPSASRLPMTIG